MIFKPLLNKIRKYTFESLDSNILEILKIQERDIKRPSPFWQSLVLLKWTIEFAEFDYYLLSLLPSNTLSIPKSPTPSLPTQTDCLPAPFQ